jgi:hypothetical protein
MRHADGLAGGTARRIATPCRAAAIGAALQLRKFPDRQRAITPDTLY